jgi:ABC-2 type transport system ATP-binding protein
MTDSNYAIETNNLRKVYRNGFVAVDGLSLAVETGKIFGFLGPNGAGKTTTINMLLTNVYPTSGTGKVLGYPIGNMKARRRLGFLPEKFQFHDFLTATEFLDLHGKLYGMPSRDRRKRIPEVLDLVGLGSRSKSKIHEFSKGMQQRVGLAQAILSDPDLIILDEPTSALDPLGRRDVRDVVRHLKELGKTIFLNSHLLGEIEMTCDEIVIMKNGKIIKQGQIDDLLSAPTHVDIRAASLSDAAIEKLRMQTKSLVIGQEPNTYEAAIGSEDEIPALADTIVTSGGRLMSLIPHRESLEDLFIRIVEDSPAIVAQDSQAQPATTDYRLA